MKDQALAANSQKPTSERRLLFIIAFLWYLYLLLLYIFNLLASVRQHRTIKYPYDLRLTSTVETESDVIVYALEKIISFGRENQYLFVANCAWWIAGIIELDSGLTVHIDNLATRRNIELRQISSTPWDIAMSVSPTPRDLTEDRRLDQALEIAEIFVTESRRARNTWQRNRVKSLPKTKTQRQKARKIKWLQEAGNKQEAKQNERLQEIRATVIQNLS
jgi:hypothetical protein